MFIQFIHANDLRPLFVLVVQFFQCLGLWNSGGKKSPTPNPPIAVSYGTWWFAPESLPYHQQNEVRFCGKTSCFFPENSSISGAPTFLAPLDGECRVSAPPPGGKRQNGKTAKPASCENPRWWRETPGLSQYHKWDPYRAIITQKIRKSFFSTWPFGFSSCSTWRWSEGGNLEFFQNDRYLWI